METETLALTTEKTVGKRAGNSAGSSRSFRAPAFGGFATLTPRVAIAGKRQAQRVVRKTSIPSEKMRRWQGKSCLRNCAGRAVSFDEIADDAIAYVKAHYSRPADDVARLEVLKGWFFGQAAETITAHQLETKLEAVRKENHWAPATRNHFHTICSLAFRLAVSRDKVKENPARKIRRVPEDNNRVRYLSDDEEKRLRAAIRSNPVWAEHEQEIDLAMHTGLCRTDMYQRLVWELSICRCASPPFQEARTMIRSTFPSTNRRCAPWPSSKCGETGVGESCGTRGRLQPSTSIGSRAHCWHDLRHTFASRLRQSGAPLGHIAELMGHKGLSMTRRYAHLSIANLPRPFPESQPTPQ